MRNAESYVALAAVAAAFYLGMCRPELVRRWRAFPRGLRWHRRWDPLIAAGASFAVCAIFGAIRHSPPAIHDEFSYLLAADTFRHGRLTNPTHPMWQHFETFHVIEQPTYQSKYPPGEGMALALGQRLFGDPLGGAWLAAAAACAALCWMLAGWVPRRWALAGALGAAVQPAFLQAWCESYWGGSLAVCGGALVMGAVRRMLTRPRARDGALCGLGLALLANSRPYEGLVLVIALAAGLGAYRLLPRATRARRLLRTALPSIGAVVLLSGTWMGYYNWRVTGSPFVTPYQVHEREYAVIPFFMWQSLRPVPAYRHAAIAAYHLGFERDLHEEWRTLSGVNKRFNRLWKLLMWYLRPAMMIPFVVGCAAVRVRWNRLARTLCLALVVAVGETHGVEPHYFAPAACLVVLLTVNGWRALARWRPRGRPVGRALVRTLAGAYAVAAVPALVLWPGGGTAWAEARERVVRSLEQRGGKHLVLVRYDPGHIVHNEWVYNGADVDRQPVVWARAMTPAADQSLIRYYRDRQVWILDGDEPPWRLVPGRISNAPGCPAR